MPSKVPCYLRTLRRQWGLTQKELAGLVPGGNRVRVSDVERGRILPRTSELLAYAFIFGVAPQILFRKYAEEIGDQVMQGACRLHERLENDPSRQAARKLELLEQLPGRVPLEAHDIPKS
jgi:transcriptional regulator with XRE-family HTH domain